MHAEPRRGETDPSAFQPGGWRPGSLGRERYWDRYRLSPGEGLPLLDVAEAAEVLLHLVGLGVADRQVVLAGRHARDRDRRRRVPAAGGPGPRAPRPPR